MALLGVLLLFPYCLLSAPPVLVVSLLKLTWFLSTVDRSSPDHVCLRCTDAGLQAHGGIGKRCCLKPTLLPFVPTSFSHFKYILTSPLFHLHVSSILSIFCGTAESQYGMSLVELLQKVSITIQSMPTCSLCLFCLLLLPHVYAKSAPYFKPSLKYHLTGMSFY